MNFGQIVDNVESIVQDLDYDEEGLKLRINEAYDYVCTNVWFPQLKTLATVQTILSQNYVDLTNLSGRFSGKVINTFGLDVYQDSDTLLEAYWNEDYPDFDEAGSVEGIAIEGNILWYQHVPETAENITIFYYKLPDQLAGDNDTPSIIPEYLHRKLLVHGAAYMFYNEIEEDHEGTKPNASSNYWESFHEKNPDSGIMALKKYVSRNRNNLTKNAWKV